MPFSARAMRQRCPNGLTQKSSSTRPFFSPAIVAASVDLDLYCVIDAVDGEAVSECDEADSRWVCFIIGEGRSGFRMVTETVVPL
jgi:hypothetical protein